MKDVNRILKLDPSNTELLSRKQRALKDAVSATTDKLETLKQAKQQLDYSDLGQDKYLMIFGAVAGDAFIVRIAGGICFEHDHVASVLFV